MSGCQPTGDLRCYCDCHKCWASTVPPKCYCTCRFQKCQHGEPAVAICRECVSELKSMTKSDMEIIMERLEKLEKLVEKALL